MPTFFSQIGAIWWAQFRTTRNHLPRRTWASILGGLVSLLWYGLWIAVGIGLAVFLPRFSLPELMKDVPMMLFGVFLFWQLGPLFTLSSGWSLQLNKLLVYPIPRATLFAIEVFLRVTTAPEMFPVLLGLMIGMLRHPAALHLWPVTLLLFIPVNLFLSLALRELILHSFERNRFRELFTILIISIGLVPQIILRSHAGPQIHPYFLAASQARVTPWGEAAHLALGTALWWELPVLLLWSAVAFVAAQRLFARSLQVEETLRAASAPESTARSASKESLQGWAEWLTRYLPDPLGALLQKELQSLVRMPRFRVMFGMACIFSVVIFLPLSREMIAQGKNNFISNNFLSVVTLYGLLILSDALLLNCFGMDRSAVETYFAAPIPFRSVLYAKNLVAVFFIGLQAALVLLVVALFRIPVNALNVGNAVGAAAVVTLFFLAAGNLSSVTAARPSNPAQTFRRSAGGKMQLWLLLCSVGMFALIGAAGLAQWAVGAAWAGFAVLAVELGIGLIVYFIAVESAIERAQSEREKLLAQLSRNASPIGLSS